jgi:glucose-6-phosphate 1-dehydrogenase
MPHTLVIFGASGDLTSRKLIPALYSLFHKRRLPAGTKIVGVARTDYTNEAWRDELAASTQKFAGKEFDAATWKTFAANVYYHPGDIGQPEDFTALAKMLDKLEGGESTTRLYYLATAPSLYAPAIAHFGAAGLADESHGIRRVVIEKPFGTDLKSAQELNRLTHQVFDEKQVYRIDHYLGKETVQNILVLRFANSIFEPLWNRRYIDHVQITVAEEVDVGRRAGYYDRAGVTRDMFQNHLLQLAMITAMEAPPRYSAELVRDEKVKVLRAIKPMTAAEVAESTVRGQYDGYLQAEGVAPGSQTATFAAIKLQIENWRWQGVPFYLRSGKAMSCRTSQIVIKFRPPPIMMFSETSRAHPEPNMLVIQIQPAEGIQLHFQSKVPDAGMKIESTTLDFTFAREFAGEMPDSYQRLLLDAMNGDASLFARSDEVETAWSIIDPIIAAWQTPAAPPLEKYPAGQWGPDSSDAWMRAQGRQWFDVCPVLH